MMMIRRRSVELPTVIGVTEVNTVTAASGSTAIALGLPSSGILQANDLLILFAMGIAAPIIGGVANWTSRGTTGLNGDSSELFVGSLPITSNNQDLTPAGFANITVNGLVATSRFRGTVVHLRPAAGRTLTWGALSSNIYTAPSTAANFSSAGQGGVAALIVSYVIEEGTVPTPEGAPWVSALNVSSGTFASKVLVDTQGNQASAQSWTNATPINTNNLLRTGTAIAIIGA